MKRTWTILVPALLLGLSMFMALIISARIGVDMVGQVVPLQDASMMIKNELSMFNLSLEQSVYVEKAGYYENVWEHLDQAEWYARAMLEGGRDKKGVYVPLKDPALRKEIMLALSKMKELRSLAEQRIKLVAGKASESKVENDFSLAFTLAWQQADAVEGSLHGSISDQLVEYEAITIGLLVACVLFTMLTVSALYMYDKRRAEAIAALTASEGRLRLMSTAVEEAPDGIQLVSLDGRIEYSNKAVEAIYGFKPSEFLDRHVNELNVDPDFADRVILPAVREKGNWTGELMVKHKSGPPFPIWLTVSLVTDGKGNPLSTVGIIKDFTERKRAEDDLRYQKLLLECMSEASIDGILVVSGEGRMLSFNRRFVEMWGIPEHVVESRSDEAALNVVLDKLTDPEGFAERVRYLYEHKYDKSRMEVSLKDGRTFDRYTAPVMGVDGAYFGRVWFFRDITERKVLERQRTDFHAMVTHDLKSPLAAILGYSELLLTDRADKFDKDSLDILSGIERSGKKLLNIVEDFLTFSRLESGTFSIDKSHVEIPRLMQDAAAEFHIQAQEKGLDLKVKPAEGALKGLLDKRLVERALQNIIQNAVSYTSKGGAVTVEACVSEKKGREVIVISVTDTGPGIPAGEHDKVFEKYYRSQRTTGVKGTGLGLAIVKAVAEAHGGWVELESAEGRGSTFRLVLPAS